MAMHRLIFKGGCKLNWSTNFSHTALIRLALSHRYTSGEDVRCNIPWFTDDSRPRSPWTVVTRRWHPLTLQTTEEPLH